MRAATLPTRPAPTGGLVVYDTSAELDRLEAMTAEEVEELDRQIWRNDFDR